MIYSNITEEFIGRFVLSYKDGDMLYVYDEITHGLYKFSIYHKNVSLVISPETIQHSSFNCIKGISKNENEIVLIPSSLNMAWVFYDVKEQKIRYSTVLKKNIRISGTITIGTNLVLIPFDIYTPIIIVSLNNMKVIKTYEKWNKLNKENTNFYIWGVSTNGEYVVFPVINSNYIGCMNIKGIRIITLNIPYSIYSISIYKDKIWILPTSGNYIYASDYNGKIVDKVDLTQTGLMISANRFIRIIAVRENIFLLPKYKGNVYVYQCKENQIIQVGEEETYLRGRLYEEELIPYWDFIVEDETLHLLPRDCRYKRISISSLESEECILCYGKNINYDKYWNLLACNQKGIIYEKRENDLVDYFQYITSYSTYFAAKENEKAVIKFWEV